MIRLRGDARTAVAVFATLLVVSGAAFIGHRLAPAAPGAATHVLTDGVATIGNGLPAIENRDVGDPAEAKRWSALATVGASVALAAVVLWRRFDLRTGVAVPAGPSGVSGRSPPSR